ncbi:jg10267, partial [Pararge aegeria aegeria]
DLYKKFRGILNKLTPQKFDTLLDKVKGLEINTQARLLGVIDLVFEKAIEEPNFSEAYAAMCSKLSMLKVPSDNAPDQCVNFRALIISKCQNQFTTDKVDENVLRMEKELAESTDPAKKKEIQDQLSEEHRRIRMRSVGNVRFIGELYKLKMLTAKIMVYCMTYLIDKLEEEKLECLCKLLTTIGEQVESEVKEQLESVFKRMQEIVDRKSNKISNRVRFMIQDVIDLRRGRSAKDINVIAKAMHHLVSSGAISGKNILTGMSDILECAPDLYIDIPMLYEYLGKFIAPQIEKKHITFVQTFSLCENIITSNHGHMFLKPVIRDLKESMGPFFVKTKWQESGLELKQWMSEEQVPKWLEDNKFEFLEGDTAVEETKKIITPNETQSKLLQLMNADENCDCIRGWVQ